MKNNRFLVVLCAALCLSLCACADKDSSSSAAPSTSVSAPAASSTVSSTVSSAVSSVASSNASTDESAIVISEKMFLTQIDDIYFNFDLYEGKTVVVEGMYNNFYAVDGETLFPVVYRRGPGCCGNDGWGGFYLSYTGTFPETDEWIRVTGTPVIKTDELGFQMLFLEVSSLEVKEDRGAEFVSQ